MDFFKSLFGGKDKKAEDNSSKSNKMESSQLRMSQQTKETSEEDWVLDSIAQYMQSSNWKIEIADFLDEHCVFFEDTEECSHQQFKVHKNFIALVEKKLDEVISSLGIEKDIFLEHCQRGLSNQLYKEFLKYLINIEDFQFFRKGMILRNKRIIFELQNYSRPGERISAQEARDIEQALEFSRQTYNAYMDQIEAEEAALREALKASEESYARELALLAKQSESNDKNGQAAKLKLEKARQEMEKNKNDVQKRLKDLEELRKIHHNNFLQEQGGQKKSDDFFEAVVPEGETPEQRKKRLIAQREKLLNMKKEKEIEDLTSAKKLEEISAKENEQIDREKVEAEIAKNKAIYNNLKLQKKI